jgi:hypothetical protein
MVLHLVMEFRSQTSDLWADDDVQNYDTDELQRAVRCR